MHARGRVPISALFLLLQQHPKLQSALPWRIPYDSRVSFVGIGRGCHEGRWQGMGETAKTRTLCMCWRGTQHMPPTFCSTAKRFLGIEVFWDHISFTFHLFCFWTGHHFGFPFFPQHPCGVGCCFYFNRGPKKGKNWKVRKTIWISLFQLPWSGANIMFSNLITTVKPLRAPHRLKPSLPFCLSSPLSSLFSWHSCCNTSVV